MLLPAECVATGDSIFHLSLPLKSAASNNAFFIENERNVQSREREQRESCSQTETTDRGERSGGLGDREETRRNPDHANYKLRMDRL